MPELNDLSGPYKPNLQWSDFSKEFLIKLMGEWQYGIKVMTDALTYAVSKRVGVDEAMKVIMELGEHYWGTMVPRHAKLANYEMNTVVDCLKNPQLLFDGSTGSLYPLEDKIISPNHVIRTVHQCANLVELEENAPEMIGPFCTVMDAFAFKVILNNPKIKITLLKPPPRKSPDDIACQWEFKIEE